MRKEQAAICLIGIPTLTFLLLSLFSGDSTFLRWFWFIVWGIRILTSAGSIIYAYYSYRLLEEKYNLFLLPLYIFLSCWITIIIADGAGPLRWLFWIDTLFFSLPAFVLTGFIALLLEIMRFNERK